MTDSVKDDVIPPEDAAAEAAEIAEFESGYAGTPTETPEDKPAAEPEAVVPEEVVPEVKYRQVTEAEWKELQEKSTQIDLIRADHAKRLDTAFGKVGGLERTLKALQEATPSGYTVEVTDDIVEEFKKNDFGEMGDFVLASLKKFAGKLKGTAPVAASVDPKVMEETVSKHMVELQLEALEDEYANWRDIVGAPDAKNEYRKWLAAQPADYQAKLGSTNSASVISRSIAKFEKDTAAAKAAAEKAAAETPGAKAAAAKAVADAAAAARKKRLAAAATPRGAGGNTPTNTDDDDLEAGYREG